MIGRFFRHLFALPWALRRALPARTLEAIELAIEASEARHAGELRFVVENALHPLAVLRGQSGRERAIEVFSALRVWDTEHNNGVLIYLLLAEHAIELVADRGVNRLVAPGAWQAMVTRLGGALHEGRFEDGLTQALEEVSALLVAHFPAEGGAEAPRRMNELPDLPVLL